MRGSPKLVLADDEALLMNFLTSAYYRGDWTTFASKVLCHVSTLRILGERQVGAS
jgi:hypothetical protein